MQRRTFLKTTAALSSAAVLAPSFAFANKESNPFGITSKPRKFSVANNYSINSSTEATQLWIPLPKDESYHKVVSFDYKGNFTEAKIVKNEYDTRVLYVKWDKSDKKSELEVNFDVIMQERTTDFSKATSSMNYPEDVKVFLEGTAHVPVTAGLTKYAKDIAKGAKTPLEKAQAVYDYPVHGLDDRESVKIDEQTKL